jgi:hypothetical protein
MAPLPLSLMIFTSISSIVTSGALSHRPTRRCRDQGMHGAVVVTQEESTCLVENSQVQSKAPFTTTMM